MGPTREVLPHGHHPASTHHGPGTYLLPVRPAAAPRIAIVADWLCQFGGAEQVIAEMAAAFPDARLFAQFDVMAAEERVRIALPTADTTFLQRIPDIAGRYRSLLPLMPSAIRTLDVGDCDLILSSHHAVAKGVRKRPGQLHVCYCHSPSRYLWDKRAQYLVDHGIRGVKAAVANRLLDRLQRWDRDTADNVDRFLVNSAYVGDRVARHYGRQFTVIHPPVDTDFFSPGEPEGRESDLYVTASRQVPYKRIDRIVAAFRSLPDRRLVVLGDGPQAAIIRAAAEGVTNIQLLGEVARERLRDWFRRARAFVFAADEDFGIVPLEAQACGTPVIALGKGGALETVRGLPGPERTGLFFDDDRPESIAQAVREFERLAEPPTAAACRANAERFTRDHFRDQLRAAVLETWERAANPG